MYLVARLLSQCGPAVIDSAFMRRFNFCLQVWIENFISGGEALSKVRDKLSCHTELQINFGTVWIENSISGDTLLSHV